MSTLRNALIGMSLSFIAGIGFAAEPGQPSVKIEIESQPVGAALNEFARQSGLQVFLDSTDGKGIVTPKVSGTFTPNAALTLLLANTGLGFEYLNTHAVAVRLIKADVLDAAKTSSVPAETRDAVLRLAQTEPTQGSQKQADPSQGEKTSSLEELEEIVVTGTHIRGAQNTTTAVTVLDREYIDSTGFATTTNLIESLPQNFALASQSGVFTPGVTIAKEQGSSVNLRAVGEGTTLVLLNGHRMAPGFSGAAADISALPLAAIERVEVLTDGASALYGSDAVGGVVNFILKKRFDGAETRLRTGWADGGVDEHRVSQTLGHSWDSGNALLSLGYYKRDLLPASERDFVPDTSLIGSLLPRDEDTSAMFSGRQQLSEPLSVFADALYTKRKSYNQGGRVILDEDANNDNRQLSATLGADWRLSEDWQLEVSGNYARNKLDQEQFRGAFSVQSLYEIRAAQLKADGSIFTLPGGDARLAVGADWRSETFEIANSFGGPPQLDQIVRSAFAEASIPLFGAGNARGGVRQLEFSLAGRLDDYSSFGSSFDPRVGLMWEPMTGLRLRGSYGTSYKAPNLADYDTTTTFAIAVNTVDPGVPSGFSNQLQIAGNDVGAYTAQESESISFGIELAPSAVPDLKLGLNYYRIRYTDRIALPADGDAPVILGNPASFGQLFTRGPSVDEVNEAIGIGQAGLGFVVCDNTGCLFNPANFDPTSVDVVVDTRRRNLSALKTNGLDASVDYGFHAFGGDARLGLSATYIFELEQQVTSISAPFDTVGTFYNPPQWRARASAGWRRADWAANLFINHSASYTDSRTSVAVPVSSYTTVDARIAYDFSARARSGVLSGVLLSLSAQNLLDEDPPRAAILNTRGDMGFDPTNANPLGRLLALELQKTW